MRPVSFEISVRKTEILAEIPDIATARQMRKIAQLFGSGLNASMHFLHL
jgi:hypothetical protein